MTDRTFTVGRLARSVGLSRSTLLYYDEIGLLRPSGRSSSNYREYTAEDAERLKQICVYREAGLPLKEIAGLLDATDDEPVGILEQHLQALGNEIARYREQQRVGDHIDPLDPRGPRGRPDEAEK